MAFAALGAIESIQSAGASSDEEPLDFRFDLLERLFDFDPLDDLEVPLPEVDELVFEVPVVPEAPDLDESVGEDDVASLLPALPAVLVAERVAALLPGAWLPSPSDARPSIPPAPASPANPAPGSANVGTS